MDRRAKFRDRLSTLYLPYYESLCAILPPEWQPYSGYRSFDQQTNLWNQGRSGNGHIVTNAKGGESSHNYGCGTDWTLWDINKMPIWMKKDDSRWQVYVDAIHSVGLKAGKDFGDIDHNELNISCSWPTILSVFDREGSIPAYQKIEDSIIK
jgi:hypothetical protein